MNETEHIEQKVSKTFHSLEMLQDIDAHPFLQTRLQAQIKEYEDNKARSTYLRFHMRDLRPALLLLLLVFNMILVILTMHSRAELHESSQVAFAEEYILTQDVGDAGF